MKLAVIIPYYNGYKFIGRCVQSLENYGKDDIYLVDNSEEQIPENLPITVIKAEKSKIGFGAAVNLGLEKIYDKDYSHVLILNQDAYFQKGHFSSLVSILRNRPPDRFASPMIYTEDFSKVMPFVEHRYFYNSIPSRHTDIDDFIAVGLIAPIALMHKLKGFDTDYYMYYEDNDLIARSKIVKPVRIYPEIHLGHHNPDLENSTDEKKERWIQRSKQLYLWRHGSKIEWFKTWLRNTLKGY